MHTYTRLCHFSRNYFLTAFRWRPPRSGFFPVGESLNIINSIQFNSCIHTTVHFQSEHVQLPKSGCKRSWAAIGACETSVRVDRTDHLRPKRIFLRKMSFAKVKRNQTKSNEGFLGPMEKGFPLVSEGDGTVVRILRTAHCFVTCDAVLMFFAVPKKTANYFLWNRKLAKFFTSFVCVV